MRLRIILFLLATMLALSNVNAVDTKNDQTAEAAPEFTDDFLNDPEHQATGQKIWETQCRHCHGKSAYPGKAPKLKPRRYEPGFVYDRISNGFRKMPAWKEVYSQQERMGIVAYIMSKRFSP